MATSTTNLGLIKPAGTDKIRIAQINGNMDIIDEKVGAVGNTSLQTQVTGLGVNLTGLEDCVGIVVDGAKSAVAASAGQYIVLKNSIISGCDDGLYTAAQAIPADTTIDSTYLTAVSGGGLNALNTQIAKLASDMEYGIVQKSGDDTISFSRTHSSHPSCILVTPYGSTNNIMIIVTGRSSTGFTVNVADKSGNNTQSYLSWIAVW